MRSRFQFVLGVALGAVVMCALGGCRSGRATTSRVAVPPGEEKAVWEALLRQAYIGKTTKLVVLRRRLEADPSNDDWGGRPRGVPADAWSAFRTAFQRDGSLPQDLDPGLPVTWFRDEEFRDLPDGDSLDGRWSAFHERFPGNSGLISLGHVGFSRDGRTAVVYGFVGSASLSASGDIFVLRKTANGWRLVQTHNMVMA